MTVTAIADRAFAPVMRALKVGAIPGAALGVVGPDGQAVRRAGFAQTSGLRRRLRDEDLFDLASLTKVLVTLPWMLELRRRGRLDPERTVGSYLPDLCQVFPQAPVRRLTLTALLSHQSGLPAWRPLYLLGLDPAALRARFLQTDWPLDRPCYSDIGYILCGLVLERLHGRTLDRLPLPPGFTFRPPPYRSVATEYCRWRDRIICGEVHDENAHALGGAAGHAGAFATIDAVLGALAGLLDGTTLTAEERDLILERRAPDRGLGWLLPHGDWPGGALASPRTIGHLGFTGTAAFVDFDRGLAWTLLTNRVHPDRHWPSGIVELRRAVADAVLA